MLYQTQSKASKGLFTANFGNSPCPGLVHMDYLTIESGKGDKDVNVLVITENVTRYAQAIISNSQTAKAMAQASWGKFFVHYDLPESIVSDQGRNFKCELVQELCRLG